MEALLFCKTEQLAKDLELFAQHAGRKTANMEDVILSGKCSTLRVWMDINFNEIEWYTNLPQALMNLVILFCLPFLYELWMY